MTYSFNCEGVSAVGKDCVSTPILDTRKEDHYHGIPNDVGRDSYERFGTFELNQKLDSHSND